ncbi:surface exclusion protein SEA1/PrgA [Enterococcus faecalis]|uniref:surface exclusion protein SEA1/PrgA n=1 Tax=Enterococcus faecalis TaxID=1351 RepID=UPI0032199F1B
MKKIASTGLSILVATGVAGIGGNEVQAAEQAQPKTPENSSTEQPTVKATQTTEQAITEKQQQVTEKQAIVDQKQQVADTAKKEKDAIDQSVKDQQAVVDQNKDALDQSQQAVTDQQAVVDEAKKVVDEATPSAIEKAKEQVATDTQAVDDQQKVVDQAQTDVNQQQAVVEEKAKETNAAKVQNDKDQQAVTAAKQADLTSKENALKDKQAATKQAQNTLDSSKEELKGHKGLNLPANFTPDYYKKLTEQEKQAMEKEALALNKVFPENQADAAKVTEMINVKNPTEKQKQQMSDYVVGLINDVREKLGLQKLKISNQAMKFAWDVAKYDNPKEFDHDVNAINRAAKENGFKEFPGQNFYENLSMGRFTTQEGKVSMYDFEKAARNALVSMLMNDGHSGYSHLDSLLDANETNMAVSISGDLNDISAKIHIISYNQTKLVEANTYEEGTAPVFKSKETLQKEVATNQEKLATAQQAESDAQQARSASQQALNTAKTTQATAEKELSVHKATLANLQAVATKSTTNYEEKVRQTAAAETNLQQTKDQLATINELIQNRAVVLEKAKTKVADAQAIEQTSAKVLKEKQEAQKAEENTLNSLKEVLDLAKENLNQKQVALKTSTRSLTRLENAQPTYEKAVNELNKAEAAVVQAQEAYENSLKSLEELKEQQAVATLAYTQAQEDLSNAKLELQQYQGILRDLEAQQAEQRRQEALQDQVAKEQQRLEREAKQQQMLVASATSADKTPGLQQLSFSKQKEQPKAQALTHSEPRKTKQVAKSQESLPQTGEQQSIWLTIMGLFMAVGAISFKNKRRKNS